MKADAKQAVFKLKQLIVPPGNRVKIHDISWGMFETILSELGESRAARLAYNNGTLEIKMPLPKRERAKSIISDFVNVSPNFPKLPIAEKITQYIKQSKTVGRSPAIRAFRDWVREQLQK